MDIRGVDIFSPLPLLQIEIVTAINVYAFVYFLITK